MNRLKNILISGILSICMVVTSLPIESLAKEAVPEQEEIGVWEENGAQEPSLYEIVSFERLTEEVSYRNVPVGTAFEELELPETLTVSYRLYTKMQEGEEETNQKSEDGFEEEGNKNDPGSVSGNDGNESNPDEESGEEGTESNPDGGSGEEGTENNPGGDSENEGTESNPGSESGEEDNEIEPGGGSENEGTGSNPGGEPGEEGTENEPSGGSENEGTESNVGAESKEEGNESNPGGEPGEEGTENNTGAESGEEASVIEPGGESGDGGTASEPSGNSAEEAVLVQNTVEVHMEEYKFQPEFAVEPEILIPDGQEAHSDENVAAYQEEDAETDSNLDREPEPDIDTGTEVSSNEDNDRPQSIETTVIENITWQSAPEYDGNTEGCYIFTPVLAENYLLGEGVALPEIAVTVGEVLEPLNDVVVGTPACGTISTDTVWYSGTLSDGELIVEPGVTLTLYNSINITGKVTIRGGGTIKRGGYNAYFYGEAGSELTIGNIVIDGAETGSGYSMITVRGTLVLDDGCVIQNCYSSRLGGAICVAGYSDATVTINKATIRNCRASNGGAIYSRRTSSKITINDGAVIENCSAEMTGGAITVEGEGFNPSLVINGGTFRGNSTTEVGINMYGIEGGGCIFICNTTLTVYGGNFIGNTTPAKGGCIHHCGHVGTTTNIYGGYFEGNTCTNPDYAGSGGVYNSVRALDNTDLTISGSVRFCGDDAADSGTDGVFLDQKADIFRKIWIDGSLSYPVTIFADAFEGYVIAEGKGYTLLKNRDLKKLVFFDTKKEEWYCRLNDKNQVYLTKISPFEDAYFVYYINNGAQGPVIEDDNNDDKGYALNATTIVKPADGLTWENREFVAWNTEPDGTGTAYRPGDTLTITGDINLYAIFRDTGTITAGFYSGSANNKKAISETLKEGADSVTITAPELKDMGDWEKVGWDEDMTGYEGSIKPDDKLTLKKDKDYYGVYQKKVTLSYHANGGKETDTPESKEGVCSANVHDEITYRKAEFSVAGDITTDQTGWEFIGWNTKQDGTGDLYREKDIIKIEEDTTLYATFVRLPYATFYSGNAGEFVIEKTNVVTGKIKVPDLKEKSGWQGIGWDEDTKGFGGSIKAGTALALEEDKVFYGVYEKAVTLSYKVPYKEYEGEKQTRKAKVCESKIFYDSESDDPDAFEFSIAPDPSMDGYTFLGWNTRAGGDGDLYRENDAKRNKITITEDTVLYGIFGMLPFATFFSGSAGDYVIVPSAIAGSNNAGTLTTPELKQMDGWNPLGWSRSDEGYSESLEIIESGADLNITEDTEYYGVYEKPVELIYDGNGWLDSPPDTQSKLLYANVHDKIVYTPDKDKAEVAFVVGNDIRREGYTFRGWSLVRDAGSLADSDFYKPKDTITLEDSATLFAQMVDDIAPVLGEASYNSGYRNVKDWIIRKKDLTITVPVTEKGSGVNKIVYTFTPESGEPVTGEALMENAGEPEQARQSEAVWLEVGSAKTSNGGRNVVFAAEIPNGTADRAGTSGGEVGLINGEIQAKITVSEDYKGTISLMCRDNAGNESPFKLLSAQGGGVIVEDNAPLISFLHKGSKNGRATVEVTVYDNADEDSNSHITGGIASVSYQIDNKQAQSVANKGFGEEIVETCTFDVEVSGVGEHTIQVTAVDNAGNESSRATNVRIAQKKKTVIQTHTAVIEAHTPPAGKNSVSGPPARESRAFESLVEVRESAMPTEKEPKTGNSFPHVEIYATTAMISGLLYVVLYFTPEQGGMTESVKKEIVARLVAWAKRGGKLRRYVALAVIFCVLVYYHSIGKGLANALKVSDDANMRRLNLWVMRTAECRTQAEAEK